MSSSAVRAVGATYVSVLVRDVVWIVLIEVIIQQFVTRPAPHAAAAGSVWLS